MDSFAAFMRGVASRLEAGAREYGDVSFERPATELLSEIEEELLDVCAWSFIAWTRLRAVAESAKEATVELDGCQVATTPNQTSVESTACQLRNLGGKQSSE